MVKVAGTVSQAGREHSRRRWLEGASLGAIASVSAAAVAATLGVSLPETARAAPNMTVNPVGSNEYKLNKNNNPITYGAGTKITSGSIGIYGYGLDLAVGNHTGGVGVIFAGAGLLTNSGLIEGPGLGVEVNGSGALVNAAGGVITGNLAGVYTTNGGVVTNEASGNIAGGPGKGPPGDAGSSLQTRRRQPRAGRGRVQRRLEPRCLAQLEPLRPLRRLHRPRRHRADRRSGLEVQVVSG